MKKPAVEKTEIKSDDKAVELEPVAEVKEDAAKSSEDDKKSEEKPTEKKTDSDDKKSEDNKE